MTVSLWRSTVTAILARSTAWHAADRRHVKAARIARAYGITAGLTTAGRTRLFLLPVLLGIGAGMLASCAAEQPRPQSPTAAVEAPQPSLPRASLPPAVPRPPHKPTPPPSPGSAAPPATIWRYKTANCELDLFFYLDLRSGRMRTLHYAFRGDAADSSRRQNCLRDLAARNG